METAAVLQEIQEEISAAVQYRHEYRQGDLVITGNTYTSGVPRYHLVPWQHTRPTYLYRVSKIMCQPPTLLLFVLNIGCVWFRQSGRGTRGESRHTAGARGDRLESYA